MEKEEVETLIGSEGKFKYDAFISYANQDKKFVYAFVEVSHKLFKTNVFINLSRLLGLFVFIIAKKHKNKHFIDI